MLRQAEVGYLGSFHHTHLDYVDSQLILRSNLLYPLVVRCPNTALAILPENKILNMFLFCEIYNDVLGCYQENFFRMRH